jgi:uncharacterized DUF497 family protein
LDIVFDPAKDLLNQAKHGASLALAEILFAAPHTVESDDRFDYGETRQVAMGRVGGRVFCMRFCRSRGFAAGDFPAQGEQKRSSTV